MKPKAGSDTESSSEDEEYSEDDEDIIPMFLEANATSTSTATNALSDVQIVEHQETQSTSQRSASAGSPKSEPAACDSINSVIVGDAV